MSAVYPSVRKRNCTSLLNTFVYFLSFIAAQKRYTVFSVALVIFMLVRTLSTYHHVLHSVFSVLHSSRSRLGMAGPARTLAIVGEYSGPFFLRSRMRGSGEGERTVSVHGV